VKLTHKRTERKNSDRHKKSEKWQRSSGCMDQCTLNCTVIFLTVHSICLQLSLTIHTALAQSCWCYGKLYY